MVVLLLLLFIYYLSAFLRSKIFIESRVREEKVFFSRKILALKFSPLLNFSHLSGESSKKFTGNFLDCQNFKFH